MEKDKRNKQKPIPNNLSDYLNEDQMLALRQIESFGWSLEFVRRPLFQDPTPVVFGPAGQIGILLEDGNLNVTADIVVREAPKSPDN